MRQGCGLWQALQQTPLRALAGYSKWVPCLSAIQCVDYTPSRLVFPNQTYKGFATTMRRVFVRENMVVLLTRPTAYHTPETMKNKLDESNPAWPTGDNEKRLVFVDLPISEQTGSFYIGTYIRHPAKLDRFLTKDEFYKLSNELQTELVDLWVPADATLTQRQNTLLDLRAGRLSVPCVVLQRLDGEYVHDIDSRLLDAVDGDRPSLGQLDLDATGCIYPEDAWKCHRHELEERAVNREFDLDAARSRRREAKELCYILATEVASLRTLGSSESSNPTFEPETPSTNKRRREGLESSSNVPTLPTSAIVTEASPSLGSSAPFSTPLPLLNPAATAPEPPNPGSQPVEESLGPFQAYRDLAPIPEGLINGTPVALINCGYYPWLLAKSLRSGVPPQEALPSNSGLVRKSITVPRGRIIWLDKPTSRHHRSRGLLLQNPIPKDDTWDPIKLPSSDQWKHGHLKAVLEPFEQEPYDGTTWHGVYSRIPLQEGAQFVSQDDLYDLPLGTKLALARAVPGHLRERIKASSSGSNSSPSSLDEDVWQHIIEGGLVKIPVVLVTFHDLGAQSLRAARRSRQGPGNLRTLFAADPSGAPHMPRIGHERILERLAKADNGIEVEEAGLKEITNLLNHLTIERETALDALSHANGSSPKKARIGEVEDEGSNLPTPPALLQPASSALFICQGSSHSNSNSHDHPAPSPHEAPQ